MAGEGEGGVVNEEGWQVPDGVGMNIGKVRMGMKVATNAHPNAAGVARHGETSGEEGYGGYAGNNAMSTALRTRYRTLRQRQVRYVRENVERRG